MRAPIFIKVSIKGPPLVLCNYWLKSPSNHASFKTVGKISTSAQPIKSLQSQLTDNFILQFTNLTVLKITSYSTIGVQEIWLITTQFLTRILLSNNANTVETTTIFTAELTIRIMYQNLLERQFSTVNLERKSATSIRI